MSGHWRTLNVFESGYQACLSTNNLHILFFVIITLLIAINRLELKADNGSHKIAKRTMMVTAGPMSLGKLTHWKVAA